MAQRARNIERNQRPASYAGSAETQSDPDNDQLTVEDGLESPARRLQNLLGTEFDADAELDRADRWPLIGSIAFIGVTSAGLWAVIWWAMAALLG